MWTAVCAAFPPAPLPGPVKREAYPPVQSARSEAEEDKPEGLTDPAPKGGGAYHFSAKEEAGISPHSRRHPDRSA